MTTTDYLIDSALILLVLLQIKQRPLTIHQLLRPLVIVSIAVACHLDGIPTAGNDRVLAAITVLIGATIGVASGQTVIMRRGTAGEALARSGWISAFFWVLGMGSRMAFLVWISHGGSATIAKRSAATAPACDGPWASATTSEPNPNARIGCSRRALIHGHRTL